MSLLSSDIARINALIHLLGIVMTIGKYLTLIVAAFAVLNLTLAIISVVLWNSMTSGVLNALFALGGFVFLAQLLGRRKIHRYEYRYHGRHSRRPRGPGASGFIVRSESRVDTNSASA